MTEQSLPDNGWWHRPFGPESDFSRAMCAYRDALDSRVRDVVFSKLLDGLPVGETRTVLHEISSSVPDVLLDAVRFTGGNSEIDWFDPPAFPEYAYFNAPEYNMIGTHRYFLEIAPNFESEKITDWIPWLGIGDATIGLAVHCESGLVAHFDFMEGFFSAFDSPARFVETQTEALRQKLFSVEEEVYLRIADSHAYDQLGAEMNPVSHAKPDSWWKQRPRQI